MPTLYDNFSQVRQYIDQEKPDLTSYVTKTELANCSYVTNSVLSSYLPLTGGTMTGQISLNNGVKLHIGSERPWDIYEGGTGGNASLIIRNTVDGKHLYIKDINDNNIVDIHNNLAGNGFVKFSYNANTYTNSIIPNENNTYSLGNATYYYSKAYTNCVAGGTGIWMNINGNNRYYFGNSVLRCSNNNYATLGSSDYNWKATYTYNLYLNGNNIVNTINGMFSYDTSTGTLTITTIS